MSTQQSGNAKLKVAHMQLAVFPCAHALKGSFYFHGDTLFPK